MTAMRDVWGTHLVELCRRDRWTCVIDGDLANSTKADMVAKAMPERFIQGGIAEQNLVGVAAGMTTLGWKPWLSSFTVFLTHRAIDQVRMVVAQTNAPVKVVGSYSGLLTGLTGRTHCDVEDLAIMRAMPAMTVLAPADNAELVAMMDWANGHDGPVYLRIARDDAPDVLPEGYEWRLGEPVVLREGADVTIVGTGVESGRALAAADLLAADGIEAQVVHVGSLKPVDLAALVASLGPSGLVVTAEEHAIEGGLGGLVAEAMATHASGKRLARIGIEGWSQSAANDWLLDTYGLSAAQVAERVRRELA
jgi:transketolase